MHMKYKCLFSHVAWAHHQQVRSKHKAENQERTVGETTEDSSCRGVNREAKQLAANRPVLQGWSVGTGVEVARGKPSSWPVKQGTRYTFRRKRTPDVCPGERPAAFKVEVARRLEAPNL